MIGSSTLMTSVMLMPDVWLTSCSKGTQKSFRTSFHAAFPAAVAKLQS